MSFYTIMLSLQFLQNENSQQTVTYSTLKALILILVILP